MLSGNCPIPGDDISPLRSTPPTNAARVAHDRLRRSGYSILNRIHCEYHDGVLRLSGSLPSHYLKQVALAMIDGVEGIGEIVNEIEVLIPPGK